MAAKTVWSKVKKLNEVAELSSGQMTFLTGHLARFADGSVELRQNDNSMLGTAVSKVDTGTTNLSSGLNLMVDFRQSAAAIGRIPTNYLRKELSTNEDIAISRIIDRSARPCFYQNYPHKSQVICKPFGLDDDGDSAVLGVNAASAALAVSSIPLRCLFAASRIGLIDGKVLVNPPRNLLKECDMNIFLTGSDRQRVLMLEMEGKQIDRGLFLDSVQKGIIEIQKIIAAIRRLSNAVGKPKMTFIDSVVDENLFSLCRTAEQELLGVLTDYNHDKWSRDDAIKKVQSEWFDSLTDTQKESKEKLMAYFHDFVRMLIHRTTIEKGVRVDGRKLTDVRQLEISVDLVKKLHGSAMFQRGQSQVYAAVTFDSPQAAFHSDVVAQLLGAQQRKTFMLNYEFPAYATGEVSESKFGQNRREIGHALLAEKALKNVIPNNFPFTIRVSAQVLESNGSTSMATACAGSLALMDAGVKLLNPVAGVAVGMFSVEGRKDADQPSEGKDYVLLTDLFGMEDHFGEMDFKIAGTSQGFTAMQLDLNNNGLTLQQMKKALMRGQLGITHILKEMNNVIPNAREVMKSSVPVIEEMELPPNYRKEILFRSAAYQAKLITAETGVEITSEDEKKLCFFAPNAEKLEQAKEMALNVMKECNDEEYLFGQFYKAEVVSIQDTGIMVTLKPGTKPILLRNYDLSNQKVGHPSVLGFEVGQQITVRYFGRDAQGFHRITRKLMNSWDLPVQNHFPKATGEKK